MGVEAGAIVVGAGAAGLSCAAQLARAGVPNLTLERSAAVADRWRNRYEGLRLNTMRQFTSFPGYRMPAPMGRYPAREDFVRYLEQYANHHRLRIRFDAELDRIDPAPGGGWELRLSRGEPLRARWVVVATGYDAVPEMPDWPGSATFAGELIHAAAFRFPGEYEGKRVLVVGAGITGVDICGHLDRAGALVSISVRRPPNLFPREWLKMPLQPAAILSESLPAPIGDFSGRLMQRAIWGDLSEHGLPPAPEGVESKFRRSHQGTSIDDGFVAAVRAGRIGVHPTISRFDGREVVFEGGERLAADAVIAATGYSRGLETLVGHLGVLDAGGMPSRRDGAPEHPAAPGLYFAGFRPANSGQMRHMPKQARRIARAISADARANGTPTATRSMSKHPRVA